MRLSPLLLSLSFTIFGIAIANVEKTIFIAPPAIATSDDELKGLQLTKLTPNRLSESVRTKLAVTFPTEQAPTGVDHWYLLDELIPGQRYEVRVCWAATQPTEFWIDTYTAPEISHKSTLTASLTKYIEKAGKKGGNSQKDENKGTTLDLNSSLLFLRIRAAADFYTTNATLMQDPPLVDVDIILDPYLLNVVPRSLLPTGLYIILVAGIAYFISDIIAKWLQVVVVQDSTKRHEE